MILPAFVPVIGAFILLVVVSGLNITLDDTDHAITYTPADSWHKGTNEPNCYMNGHRWASEAGAYATFNFTGVAVYYLMPLFQNYIVSTLLTLDNGPPVKVDLTRPRSAPITSAVRWSASGLKNQTHTVVVSLSPDEQDSWGQVDGFIYTVADTSPSTGNPEQILLSLQKCQPCGKSKCSFSPEGSPSYDTHILIVGEAVSNCEKGVNQSVTTTYSREIQILESWSVDTTIGSSFSVLNVHSSGNWSSSPSLRANGQAVTLTIPPGKVAALTTAVSYRNTSGTMRIGSDSFKFSSLQPVNVMNFGTEYTDCGSQFNVSTLSTIECTKSTSVANKIRCPLMLIGLVGIVIFWKMI